MPQSPAACRKNQAACSPQHCVTGRGLGKLELMFLLSLKSGSKDLLKHTLFSFFFFFLLQPSKAHHFTPLLIQNSSRKKFVQQQLSLPSFHISTQNLYLAPYSSLQKCKHFSAPALPNHQYYHFRILLRNTVLLLDIIHHSLSLPL